MSRLTFANIAEYEPLLKLKRDFTLENFMNLHANDDFCWFVHSHAIKQADEWLEFFKTAKSSWDEYGNNPPIGSMVRTLRAGFSGSGNDLRQLKEYEGDNYFLLEGKNPNTLGQPFRGISIKQVWFLDFKVST